MLQALHDLLLLEIITCHGVAAVVEVVVSSDANAAYFGRVRIQLLCTVGTFYIWYPSGHMCCRDLHEVLLYLLRLPGFRQPPAMTATVLAFGMSLVLA